MRKATQQRPACSTRQVKLEAQAYESRIGIDFEEQGNEPTTKVGYLANVKPTTYADPNGSDIAAVILYFVQENSQWFKCIKVYAPYFYVQCADEYIKEMHFYLQRRFENQLKSAEVIHKEDLELVNHLSGKKGRFIKLSFKNVQDLMEVKMVLAPIVEQNKVQQETYEAYEGWMNPDEMANGRNKSSQIEKKILAIREYDVAYHIRTLIDNEIRCAQWYEAKMDGTLLTELTHLPDKLDKADLRIFAFDIETTKAHLKFPDSKFDQIMMISYIIDGAGFLITNRQIVGADVEDFEYSPKPEYDVGQFKVFNEPDEKQLLIKFFDHIRETKPFIFTTFNGDFFDWPFIQDRAEHYQLKIEEEIGVYHSNNGEIMGRFAAHLDCFYWVKRDAYLPQGSHGLKAVTKAKLGYDPVELDPELMLPYAQTKPQELAEYSVSDAVATYFLYKKLIHDFIFALCTIIPTYPDEVLRRGSGTLCENLLMAQAFRGNIIFPNKQTEKFERFHNGKLVDTDTYIGGTVECLQQGVYRSDIPVKFKLVADGYQKLIDETDDILKFAIEIESGQKVEDVENYEEIKSQVIQQLNGLQDQCPFIESEPLIYHVDVAAMYPNIILSNRLQPVAIVNEQICAGCVFNKDVNRCKRNLDWQWRGEMFPLSRKEFEQVKNQLEYELEMQKENNKLKVNTDTMTFNDKLKQRVKKYCQTAYKQIHQKKTELKTDTVCMRENPFYVDTVRDFRDRRYEYKRLVKVWVAKFKEASKEQDQEQIEVAKNRMSLFESLQLAHKIILNSFYGYVMKKGARWYSMEMAAMVTHTGGSIITDSRQLLDQIGMPLELDTDGIWTLLPKTFPESFSFIMKNGKKINFDFPCTMCNNLIYEKYGNSQYQTLKNKDSLEYETRSEMSIFFEIDGPYKCMLIPASKEEGKMLKKRYAVFNHAGKMTEVKGFELKRRGELKIIKIFQEEVFSKFLVGDTLQECYDACGEVGERWYDILESKGEYVDDAELIEYIGEERVMQRAISEYADKKSTSITCAKRLAEFLGDEILKDDGGLNVKFIISKYPIDAKVADRAIPTAILEMEKPIKEKYLKKWLGDRGNTDFDIRSILDWDYYKERLGGAIQKIVTIPAALQKCMNPIPAIQYPDWLHKRIKADENKFKQKDIQHFFKVTQKPTFDVQDLQTMGVIDKRKANKMQMQKKEKDQIKQSKEKYSKIHECPDPSVNANFGEWFKYQKQNWRNIRKNFKEHKQIVHQNDKSNPNQANRGLSNFIRNMDDIILNSNWHIISIENTFEPGIMKLWAITENSHMFAIKLKIPRIIYINSKVQKTQMDTNFRKANNKILPRNRKTYHLYEWEGSEEMYQDNYMSYNYLLDNNIEGIYETQMPLKFRAIYELGCVIRPRKSKIPTNEQAQGRVYSIDELEIIKQNQLVENPYMQSHTYEQIYLIHHNHGSRHVLCLFQCNTKVCQIVIVNRAAPKVQQNNELIGLRNIFAQILEELEQQIEMSDWEITSQTTVNDLGYGLKLIDKLFLDYKSKNKSATIVVLQSEIPPERLQFLGLKTMVTDFPVIRYPIVAGDNKFPSLTWITFAFKNIIMRFMEVGDWLKERVCQSRYAYVPVGNIGADSTLSIIDVLYARSLSCGKHVLWYSNTSVPDLGGHQDQDFRSYFQEEIENPELTKKGFYRGYTIEIDVSILAINTILQSEFFKEFEEATMAASKHGGENAMGQNKSKMEAANNMQNQVTTDFDTDLDEFVTCSNAFRKLKELISAWLDDVTQKEDIYADHLVCNVYRWLSSSKTSKLYDPLLHRLVHKLMTKSFYLLLRRFKQLGCKVIYASFHKIFIYTEKKSFDEAESQIAFVLQNIKQNNLFSFITLNPAEYWRILLFKDLYNHGGIKESQPDKVCERWDIVQHLPEITQKQFRLIVGEYILKVHNYNQKLEARKADKEGEGMPAGEEVPAEKKIESYMDAVDDIKKEPDHDYVSKLIITHFSQKLFCAVSDFMMKKSKEEIYRDEVESDDPEDDGEADELEYQDMLENYYDDDPNDLQGDERGKHGGKRRPNNQNDDRQQNMHVVARRNREKARKLKELKKWEFPQNIGSHQLYVNAALEFSKFITTHIFGLDDAFQQEAYQVKTNLLRMIHCKEFSQEAQEGMEPSLILVIPDVICEFCQKCSDLDICRDPSLNEEIVVDENALGENIIRGNWACSVCDHELNKLNVERKLLDLVNRRLISYQMQDLKCKKCNMIKNSVVAKYCECTGEFVQTNGHMKPETLKNQNLLNQMTDINLFMQLIRNFANYHSFTILKDTTEQIIQVLAC